MAYTKTVWQDLPDTSTPITADRLNNIEDGIEYLFEHEEESGSNENGNWIKYSDGTMICWNHIEVTDQAIDTTYGSLYQGSRTISFPVAFNSTPSVHCSLFHWGTSASWGCVVGANTTAATIRGLDISSRATGTICEISWQAIGRWK